jgi:C-terminal processing protease CtpA/Prc
MLYLQHHKDYEIEQERDKSGVRIVKIDGQLKVYSVKSMPGAIVEGLKKDDIIISINGKKELSLFQARRLLRQKEGTRLQAEVERDGKTIKANIVLGKDPL